MRQIFRDRERMEKIINDTVAKDLDTYDEAMGSFMRIIGNGKADNCVVIGIDVTKQMTDKQMEELDESFHLIEGRFEDLTERKEENPVILSLEKAKSLNVKINDTLRGRYTNIFGQKQSARFTVVGIMKNDNIFMQGVIFTQYTNLKNLLSLKNYECGNYQVTILNPRKNAAIVADRIHAALKPGPAFIYGTITIGGKSETVTVLPYLNDDDSKALIKNSFTLSAGDYDAVLTKDGAMISQTLASAIGVGAGDSTKVFFKPKFATDMAALPVVIKGVFKDDSITGQKVIYINENAFYKYFYENIPDLKNDTAAAFIPGDDAPFKKSLGNEWILLPRTKTTDDFTKKMNSVSKLKTKATSIDVNSMYETASDVLKLEGALNLITFGAVLVLFFIILIGVVNTLRMTIRERTREIGTIRAIGMQKRDVKLIFIFETASLTIIASLIGTVLSFIIMGILSVVSFNIGDNPIGILLVNKHLHFLPTVGDVISNNLLILIIAVVTAYFPAKRAANLSSAEALRHYE